LLSPYQTILNEKLWGGKQTILDSFFKRDSEGKISHGKEPDDPQPGLSGLQAPVL
jgi:hypothetical protein